MPKAKKDRQLTQTPEQKDKSIADDEKTTNKKAASPEVKAEEAEPSAEQKNTALSSANASENNPKASKEKKKPAKKLAQAVELPVAEPSSEVTETSNPTKPVKKTAKRNSPIKKEVTEKSEPLHQPITITEAAAEVLDHIEPVTVAEEKNEALVHKLIHHTDALTEHVKESNNDVGTENSKPAGGQPAEGTLKIKFIITYYTKPGQTLYITAEHPLFGNGNAGEALPMQFLDEQHWHAELTINKDELTKDVVYNYLLKEEDGTVVYDGGKEKKLTPSVYTRQTITLVDAWDFAGFYDNAFFTEPFKNVLFKNTIDASAHTEPETFTHIFKIKAPLLLQGQVICITGSSASLKNWNTSEPLFLYKQEGENEWQVRTNLLQSELPLNYKYGVYDSGKNVLVQLESGENRILTESFEAGSETIVSDGFIRTADNTWKGAGVAVPVFSLRSESSFGCGEFADIKKLVDWSKSVGLKLIQLLPVNDTTSTKTWKDSYPYAAISAFALHAMYLNAEAMTSEENKHLLDQYKEEAERLNALPAVDYEAVNDIKWKIIHEVYPLQSEATFASEDYKNFFEDNRHWLVPYAVFCVLRDKFNTADFNQWNEHKNYNTEAAAKLLQTADNAGKAGMYYFIQYHLHLQLKDASDYAHRKAIVVKGDIPIGIARNSADAWQHPQLFHINMQAGAPPDPFAVKGQNWGFPTYNWPKMKEDGFAWWKQRFSQMSHYFDAFRIDHILGFFRIWSIPVESVEGIMGRFVPAIPVDVNEFQQWNTYFNYNRYTKPFITDQVLADLFGDQQQYVKDTFLVNGTDGTYSLKPEVATQKRVETWFAIHEKNDHNDWLKQNLFDLISNVILFEEEGSDGQQFHFRFNMEKTASYQHLDDYTKKQLYYLSINYFYERQNEFWRAEALQKLPALKQETDMLICGEDLGLVPASVPRVMQDLGLLSLEVQRMPKDEKATFTNLNAAPYLSVVTPSTHDMSTIRGWWEEDRNLTQNFYNQQLGQWGEAPFYCEPWINKQVVEQHLYSPAMWSIFQLQDLMGINGNLRRPNPHEERINVPAIPNYYWNYRMHVTMEDLMKESDFNDELKAIVTASGR